MAKTKALPHETTVACPKCGAADGERCKNYLGKGKQSCPEREDNYRAYSGLPPLPGNQKRTRVLQQAEFSFEGATKTGAPPQPPPSEGESGIAPTNP